MNTKLLIQELALALEIASILQAWENPSPFQDKINELLVLAGRKSVTPDIYVDIKAVKTQAIKCSCCGKFISNDGLEKAFNYTPDTHFSSEKIEFICQSCGLWGYE